MTTVYLDTSSLVKLYVEQTGSDEVRQDLAEASVAATSLVAYAEARAAFARLRREDDITASAFRAVKRDLDNDWPGYLDGGADDRLVPLRRRSRGTLSPARFRQYPSGLVPRSREYAIPLTCAFRASIAH